jgi:glyoxylase I family protein
VSDTERSLRFYRDVLGMEDQTSMRNAELPFPGAFVRAGTHQIRIMEYGNAGIPENPDHVGVPARAEDPLVGRPEHAGRDRHLALTIQDLAPLKQALVDAGVTYTMSKSGRAALFCRDPDGNGIEFMETPNLAESANESLRRFSEEMQNNPERAAEVERRIAEELRDINSGIDWGP